MRDGATGARKHVWGVDGRVRGLVPIPGGSLLAGLVEVKVGVDVRVWDTDSGNAVVRFETLLNAERSRWAVSPDGRTFLVVNDERATGYDPATGRKRFTWKLADHDVLGVPRTPPDRLWGRVRAVAASAGGKVAALEVGGDVLAESGQRANTLVLVEAETGRVIRRARHAEALTSWLKFSPDGRWLAGPRGVREVATLREVRSFPAAPAVWAVGFSPDGRRVATGHANGTALVWPLGEE